MGEIAAEIDRRLRRALTPDRIEIIDDSHQHLGHAGHRAGGESHFTVIITAAAFTGLSRVAKQRMVYAALGDLMAADRIHALIIRATSPTP